MTDPIRYPDTRRDDITEELFGTSVADPYRWLENDVRGDSEVADWVERQNAVTNTYLASLPARDWFRTRIQQLYDYERFGLPEKKGSRYFYAHNSGLQQQAVLMVREGVDGAGRVLIDPNGWSADGATALAEWTASDNGEHLLYAVQDGGSDWRIAKVLDVATGKDTGDVVEGMKFTLAATWNKDGSGFFYSRYPEVAEEDKFQALNENHKIYFHRLGNPQSADRLVYETPAHPSHSHYAQITDDGNWLVITTSEGTDDRYQITLIDLREPAWPARTIIHGLNHHWSLAGNVGTRFYWSTNSHAPRMRIVTMDIEQSEHPEAHKLVPEDVATLEGAAIIGHTLIASYLVDARTEIRRFALDGKPLGAVALPGIGTASGFGGTADDPETFFFFTSFNEPATIYRHNVATGESTPWAAPKLLFDPADFHVEQRFYASKDGTRVPMFVVRRKDSHGPAPTLLYAYGGFGISMTPAFGPSRIAWMEQGGVLAIANIRGGGEYGKAWHDGGRLANKQNSFDDFIAAGEYLIEQGIAGQGQLAIQGGSNGGLLVGAVTNQRPDLFAAALPAVGVMDMLRFDRWTAGRYWVDDYGKPGEEADFRNLHTYSPYHNVRDGEYPAILVTTADTDDRVVPGHSFKYAAAIQAAALGDRPHLIRIETRAGHGSGKPTDKIIEEAADLWAFAARWTGLEIAPR